MIDTGTAETRGNRREEHMRYRFALAALVAGIITIAGVPVAASAHTPTVVADCDTLTVDATSYTTRPSSGTPTIEVENPDYRPGVDATSSWWVFAPNDRGPFDGIPTFPTDDRGTWIGPKTDGGPGQDLVGVFQQGSGNGSWFYRETTPGTEPVGTPTINVDNPGHIPADDAPNTVRVVVDGDVLADDRFGTSYTASFPLTADIAHTYEVVITAWDDPNQTEGWSRTFSGTTTPCTTPTEPTPGPDTDEEPTPTDVPSAGPGVADEPTTVRLAATGPADRGLLLWLGGGAIVAGLVAVLGSIAARRSERKNRGA